MEGNIALAIIGLNAAIVLVLIGLIIIISLASKKNPNDDDR